MCLPVVRMDFLVSCCKVKSHCTFVVACLLVIDHLAVSYQFCLVSFVMCFFSFEEQCRHWVHFVIPLLINDLYLTRLCCDRYCTACSRASSLHSSAIGPCYAHVDQGPGKSERDKPRCFYSALAGALHCMLPCQHRMRSHTEQEQNCDQKRIWTVIALDNLSRQIS